MYLIWHTTRQGWISQTGGTTTDLTDAQRFDRDTAILRCRNNKDHTDTHVMLPVAEEDL